MIANKVYSMAGYQWRLNEARFLIAEQNPETRTQYEVSSFRDPDLN